MSDMINDSGVRERPGIVYLAVCRTNQKAYVGKTMRSFNKRTSEHKYDSTRKCTKQLFHRAVAEHGYDKFDFAVLEFCTPSELKERETFWIEYFGSRDPDGYNVSRGPGMLGIERPQEFKDAARNRMLGIPKSEIHKSHLRGPKSPEHIANAIKARQSEEYKQRASDGQYRAWSTRSREKQSENTKEQWRRWRAAREAAKRA